MEGNYETLANAIIIQAVKDFRAAYKRHLICPEDAKANRDIQEITRFFCSQYFEALSDLDGPALLHQLMRETNGKK